MTKEEIATHWAFLIEWALERPEQGWKTLGDVEKAYEEARKHATTVKKERESDNG